MEFDWKGFLRISVVKFRDYFEHELSLEEKAMVSQAAWVNTAAFTEPCQIAVFETTKPSLIALLVTHDPSHPDYEFRSYDAITSRADLHKRIREERPFWEKLLDDNTRNHLYSRIFQEKGGGYSAAYSRDTAVIVLPTNDAKGNPEFIARKVFDHLKEEINRRLVQEQRKKIEKSASTLKQEALSIENAAVKERLLSSAMDIQQALQRMKQLDQHESKLEFMEEEIKGVRRLIGATREYQDFRVLTSTVDDIRRDYVARSVFEETVKRLEEKMEALNVRLDDIREVRIWSKRTMIDIVLALIAAAATIYAAVLSGFLHF